MDLNYCVTLLEDIYVAVLGKNIIGQAILCLQKVWKWCLHVKIRKSFSIEMLMMIFVTDL